MNLVFIYGPPAAGKTTVGRELAALTGYKFFYNHLTVPAAKALFPESQEPHPQPEYTRLLHRLRLDALTAAADARLDTIFTLAYSGEADDAFVARIVAAFETKGGAVYFVELHAPEEVLARRAADPSREALHMGKITSAVRLRTLLRARDMFCTVPYPGVLKLNTAEVEPAEAARRIVERFALRTED